MYFIISHFPIITVIHSLFLFLQVWFSIEVNIKMNKTLLYVIISSLTDIVNK